MTEWSRRNFVRTAAAAGLALPAAPALAATDPRAVGAELVADPTRVLVRTMIRWGSGASFRSPRSSRT